MESTVRRRAAIAALAGLLATMPVIARAQTLHAAPSAGAATSNRTEAPGEYLIGPEDVLDVMVWRNPELAKTVQVRPDGRISLPLVNDVAAADLTPLQLKAVLTKGYASFITDPEVSVMVKEVHSVKVSVIGLVKAPGRFELRSRATVLDALALAGGFTEFAKRDRVVVRRRDGTSVPFNYGKVLDDGDAKDNVVLRPGDIVIVP
jgi:polysaccharide biosynthesis/export protein